MLKQRLVGALVLSALAILVWPIIFVDQSLQTPAERLDVPQVADYERLPAMTQESFEWPEIEEDARVNPQALTDEPEVEVRSDQVQALTRSETVIKPISAEREVRSEPPSAVALDQNGYPIAYTLQVMSLTNRADAQAVSEKLKAMEYKAYIVEVDRPEGIRFRVYIGPKVEREALVAVKRSIDQALGVDSLIVRYWP
ncbi:MAG: SPOR domain-containing protein [Proteobacteria bacterium]|jgi:DedD protein|nr:SPOR domain-containing protein [Pseudomonadota bacterium]